MRANRNAGGGNDDGQPRERRHVRRSDAPTSEDQFVDWFDEAYWRDQDTDESILFYEFGQLEWQIAFGSNGRLKCLEIGEPLLADPQQRSAYRVTKNWPPG